MPARPLQINLMVPTAWVYGAEIARGVLDISATQPRWNMHLLRDRLEQRADLCHWLAANPCDAAIVLPRFPGCCEIIASTGATTVAVCDDDEHQLMRVGIDDEAVGAAAGHHLRDRGFSQFAYLRSAEGWSVAREGGFRDACGGPVACLPPLSDRASLDTWLRQLPKPTGLFAGNDVGAARILERCARLKVEVPNDIAVVGADDDQLLCLSTRPTLSSVHIPWREVGREAAHALIRMLRGGDRSNVVLPPLNVNVRPSSDVLSVIDPLTAASIVYIRAHAADGINVADVVGHLGCSRS